MSKYLFKASLTAEGVAGVVKEGGTARREVVQRAVASAGGTVEAFYFAFGPTDVFLVADLPDNVSAAALALTIGSTGLIGLETVVLLTPEEIDAARDAQIDFRPPGR
jgi:uncharacterized protein with GYD domain